MEGYLAEVRMFAGNFNPRGWMFCNGQLLSIAQWTAVFALVGTTYGGNGQTTFGLPDLRGRVAVGAQGSQGPGLPPCQMGEMAGTPSTTLLSIHLPVHNHTITGSVSMVANGGTDGQTDDPAGRRLCGENIFTNFTNEPATMAPLQSNLALGIAGANQPVNTMPPYLGMNYIICVEGIFPSRN